MIINFNQEIFSTSFYIERNKLTMKMRLNKEIETIETKDKRKGIEQQKQLIYKLYFKE